jgi:hypothetical protein
MSESDLATVIEAAVTEKLDRLEARRHGKTDKPRKGLEQAETSCGVRHVSAPVKRAVWERDGGRCTFVDAQGRRCTERRRLEYHHAEKPFARGGDRSVGNIALMCPTHNQYLAELEYGKDVMERHRRRRRRPPASSVSEPSEWSTS